MKKKTSSKTKENLFESSIFGQLGKFGISLIKSGLDTANMLKNQLNKNLLRIGDKQEEERIKKEIEYKILAKEGIRFFAQNSAHIEVVRNKNLERVYFFLQPFCHCLPKEIKNDFNDTVDRVSAQSKVNGLVQASDEIIQIMQHEERLKVFFGKNKFLALFAQHVNLWKDLAFILTIVLNFLIIFSFSEYSGDEVNDESEFEARMNHPRLFLNDDITNTESIFDIIGLIMIVCSLFVVLFFLIKKAPLVIQKAWEIDPINQNDKKKKGILARLLSFLFKTIFTVITVLKTIEIVYYLLYGFLAIIGVLVHPFFFSFHLTEVLLRYFSFIFPKSM